MKKNRSPSKIKLGPILLSEIEAARERIQGIALRTPLIELPDADSRTTSRVDVTKITQAMNRLHRSCGFVQTENVHKKYFNFVVSR